MKWNNRIIERELKASNGTTLLYGLHETYYNAAGLVTGFTQEPVTGYYDTVEDLIATLEQQLADAKKCLANRDIIVEKGFIFVADDAALPDTAKVSLIDPQPNIQVCTGCRHTNWRFMGCYMVDQTTAQNGFECMTCRHRTFENFQLLKPAVDTSGELPAQPLS